MVRMSKEVVAQLKAIDATAFDKLHQIQIGDLQHAGTVSSQMSVAYGAMFGFCALAYLIAWTIMKILVPKHRPITNL